MRETLTLCLLLSCAVLVFFMPPGRILLTFCLAVQMHMDKSQCTSLANYRRAGLVFGFALYATAGHGAAEFQRQPALPARRQVFEPRVSPLDSRAWASLPDTRTLPLISDLVAKREIFPFSPNVWIKYELWIPNWVIVRVNLMEIIVELVVSYLYGYILLGLVYSFRTFIGLN